MQPGGNMGDSLILEAKKRDLNGAKPKALRRDGVTPAVIHDHGKESHHIIVEEADLRRIFARAGKHAPVEINVEGKKYTALIKDLTHKPASKIVFHTVFQAVSATETVSAEIPIKLTGDIPAEKANLLIVTGIDHVVVEALSKDLIDVIEIDASKLAEAGDKITVADIIAPKGLRIMTDSEQLVAGVEIPKDQAAEADASAAELADPSAAKPEELAEETAPAE